MEDCTMRKFVIFISTWWSMHDLGVHDGGVQCMTHLSRYVEDSEYHGGVPPESCRHVCEHLPEPQGPFLKRACPVKFFYYLFWPLFIALGLRRNFCGILKISKASWFLLLAIFLLDEKALQKTCGWTRKLWQLLLIITYLPWQEIGRLPWSFVWSYETCGGRQT